LGSGGCDGGQCDNEDGPKITAPVRTDAGRHRLPVIAHIPQQTLTFKDWRIAMQVVKKMVFTGIIFMASVSVQAASLCSPEEKSLFSCQLEDSKKSVSLCQSNTDPKQIFYKFGTPEQVEITLPNEKSPKAKIFFEQFGPSSSQWMKGVVFTSGKVAYSLVTPQGISVQLTVDGIKKPLSMTCDADKGDSGNELSDAYDLMEKLKFKKR
jgi:hypothetical protein